jgi:mono/diheme cytochrome c family protein
MRPLLPALLLLSACHTGDLDPMEQQSKFQEYEASRHFDDERAMRTPIEGTVPRERDLSDPPKVTAELVALGHEKFNQICTPCHGLVGDGKGSVAHKMSLRQPPSFHDKRRRGLTSEWIYNAITEGYGLMPRFTTQLDRNERWAVVAYLRALQRSQDVAYDALPADLRQELDHPKPKTTPAPHGAAHESPASHGLSGKEGAREEGAHEGAHHE